MVANSTATKNVIHQFFSKLNPNYIKEKRFSKDIYLLIVIMNNKLEFNVSVVPRHLISVKPPLWKVIADKTGLVSEKN